MKPTVLLLATGGTIAMKPDPVTGGAVPAMSGDDLLASVSDLARHARIDVANLSNVPSAYMDPPRWTALTRAVESGLSRPEVAGIVISHGTDTLEETAWWLDLTIVSEKPVVLTGAQRDAAAPDFDGPRNLLDAVRTAIDPLARGRGVLLAMNGRIHAARHVTKMHTADLDTFQSGDHGCLGEVDAARVAIDARPLRRLHVPLRSAALPRVDIVCAYGGADGDLLRHAVERGAQGIVVEALGMGNVNESMFDAIRWTLSQSVAVVIATRVPNGPVMPHYGYAGGGRMLQEAGAILAGDLKPAKARILLMLLLQHGAPEQDRRAAFAPAPPLPSA